MCSFAAYRREIAPSFTRLRGVCRSLGLIPFVTDEGFIEFVSIHTGHRFAFYSFPNVMQAFVSVRQACLGLPF